MNKRRRYKAKRKRAEKKWFRNLPRYTFRELMDGDMTEPCILILSPVDQAEFVSALNKPPEPNERLRALMSQPDRFATDDEARAAGKRMIDKHRGTLERLAAYDACITFVSVHPKAPALLID